MLRSRKRLSGTKSSLPFKKEKDCELTVQQKEYNKEHSKRRIAIEHVICRIKSMNNE
ncbi:transposase family protein [Candidatus Nitrosocosmicus sp. T]